MSTAQQHSNVSPMAPKPTISFVTVTPDVAKRWLKGNTVNRNVRVAKVNQYASDMLAGRWTHSESMICFTSDGKMVNGQHRLLAVIQSNCAITFAVQRNVPIEAMANMDTGAARIVSDVFRWNGEKNAPLLGSTAKFALIFTDGRIYKDNKVQATSHSALVDFVDIHPELRHSVSTAQHVYAHLDCAPTVLAVAHWIIAAANNAEVADHFLNQLGSRAGEGEGSAILALDRRLREIRRTRAKYTQREFLALLIKGWNHYATGKSVEKLSIIQRGTFRIPAAARWVA